MLKAIRHWKMIILVGVIAVSPFQNCAEQGLLIQDMASMEASTDSPNNDSKAYTEISEVAPVDAKQTVESMMSLLNLKPTEVGLAAVNSEVNYRRNLLVPSNDLTLINSPSIIATTSLAAVMCNQALAKEKKGNKDIFQKLDFSKGPGANGKIAALNTLITMSDRFWMRRPTNEELTIYSQMIDEYYKTLNATALKAAGETDKLAIFLCTGLLASPESYTL